MTADPIRIEIHLDVDVRLIVAAAGAVGYLAGAAGLSEPALSGLQEATTNACREASVALESPMPLTVSVGCFCDRIEVEVTSVGSAAPALGLGTLPGLAEAPPGGTHGPFLAVGVDRVEYESSGPVATTRLTKYLEPPTSEA